MFGSSKMLLLWLAAVSASAGVVQAGHFGEDYYTKVLSIHGSGTTNPSRCYWRIMDQLEAHAKLPIRLSYRAIGSGNGQKEFLNQPALTDFGSGDIPIPTDKRADFTNLLTSSIGTEQKILQLPVVLGAISFFHNVPGIEELKLPPCELAQIFNGDIQNWNDPRLTALNPQLTFTSENGLPIRVVRRQDGSSSTASITKYLNVACEEQWPSEKVGSKINEYWGDHTIGCSGSGGMVSCLNQQEGSIGYSDAGHGLSSGFKEVFLKNRNGNFVSSAVSSENNGIASAASRVNNDALPMSADMDFGSVHFINKLGDYTWPIVAMSYVYVRQDISYMKDPVAEGLLITWLKSLYQGDYINQCVKDFGFTKVADTAYDIAMNGIESMITSPIVNNTEITAEKAADIWEFETKATPLTDGKGQQDYVISAKRNTFSVVQLDDLDEETETLMSDMKSMQALVAEMSQRLADLKSQTESLQTDVRNTQRDVKNNGGTSSTSDATDGYLAAEIEDGEVDIPMDDETKVNTALALSIISIIFWVFTAIFVFSRKSSGIEASSAH